MGVRPLSLPVTPSLSYGIAGSSQTEHNCPICGKPVDINTSKAEAVSKAMHEGLLRSQTNAEAGHHSYKPLVC